jgi:hypothetical protein
VLFRRADRIFIKTPPPVLMPPFGGRPSKFIDRHLWIAFVQHSDGKSVEIAPNSIYDSTTPK